MLRHRATILSLALAIFCVAMSGCGVIRGAKSTATTTFTPTLTGTPTNTPTPTSTPTPTASPTPTVTPTPALPSNPDALQRWNRIPATYCVVPGTGYVTDDVFIAQIVRAFAAWGVPSINSGACDAVTDDDVNEIGWGDLSTGTNRGPDVYEAGLTSLRYQRCTAGCNPNDLVHIIEADITIDTAPPRQFRSRRCLSSTLLHEVGHFLGLDHLPPLAVMAAETSTCLDTLTEADRAALFARYGPVARPAE